MTAFVPGRTGPGIRAGYTVQQPTLFPPDKPRCECEAKTHVECQYEQDRRAGDWPRKRPANCLCAVDPKTAEIPF